MKRNLFKINLSLLLLIVASFSFAQTIDNIEFEKKTQKFSKVDEGKILTFEYFFAYTGNINLHLIAPKVDCSCTEVVIPELDIKPNSSNSIKVKFDTSDKIGYQKRDIFLQFVSSEIDKSIINKKITFKGVVRASKATKTAYKKSKKR